MGRPFVRDYKSSQQISPRYTRLCEIKEPGVYSFEVSRFDEQSKTKVRSNTVRLKIVP